MVVDGLHKQPQVTEELLLELVKALVDDANAVSIKLVRSADQVIVQIAVAPEDIGKLIGKNGRTARSLRTLLSAISAKQAERYSLDILEAS